MGMAQNLRNVIGSYSHPSIPVTFGWTKGYSMGFDLYRYSSMWFSFISYIVIKVTYVYIYISTINIYHEPYFPRVRHPGPPGGLVPLRQLPGFQFWMDPIANDSPMQVETGGKAKREPGNWCKMRPHKAPKGASWLITPWIHLFNHSCQSYWEKQENQT